MTDDELAELAKAAAGNWQSFDSFCWNREYDGSLENPQDWAIVYTSNRDSRLTEESNAAAIEKELEPYLNADDPDIIAESHNHWACGYVDGYAIRVYRDGIITEAFRKWCELCERLENYSILDEEDYSRREYEATLENISNDSYSLTSDYVLPDKWEQKVYDWFRANNQTAIDNRDDQGGYPSEEDLQEAFDALGYEFTGVVDRWDVIVSNIGTVYSDKDSELAWQTYNNYIFLSKGGYGRTGNETVTLLYDNEIVDEYRSCEEK